VHGLLLPLLNRAPVVRNTMLSITVAEFGR
jgi:hypothetical protein